MVQNHLLSQCHKIERWVYGCDNMSSATRYDRGFLIYMIYFGDDDRRSKSTKIYPCMYNAISRFHQI